MAMRSGDQPVSVTSYPLVPRSRTAPVRRRVFFSGSATPFPRGNRDTTAARIPSQVTSLPTISRRLRKPNRCSFFSERTLCCDDHQITTKDLNAELAAVIHSIHIFFPDLSFKQLHEEGPAEVREDEETGSFCREWNLPSLDFLDIWDHLHFDDDLKPRLLRYVDTALLFSEKGINADVINWNRLVLLHGPPGTGKTSLCKALAQKLSILLHAKYTGGIRLMEVNAHSLFSKWFSESGKLVAKLFDQIHDFLQSPEVLLFVLIDEVESLTSARKSAVCGSEPSDALRAVNALLTQLDRLQRCSNVVVMTTSNITEAIDDAFLDRADIKTFVGPPGITVRYRILHRCLMELQRVGCVEESEGLKESDLDVTSNLARCSLDLSDQGASPQTLLYQCSKLTEGCSCRAMKKLPFLAYSACRIPSPIPCVPFLQALWSTVISEQEDRDRLPSTRK